MTNKLLLKAHGDGLCHICGLPKITMGSPICSYPHARIPERAVDDSNPDGFWSWVFPEQEKNDE
jgi:hypothetical protein